MAAPRASRDQTNCLHICVPGSCTAKIYCTFEQQTVTCEETHARNADTTQKNGTYLQNGVNRPKCPRAAVFDARKWFGCSTHEEHTYETENIFKQHTAPRRPRCGADIAVVTRHCLRNGATVSHVGPSDGHLRPEFGRI